MSEASASSETGGDETPAAAEAAGAPPLAPPGDRRPDDAAHHGLVRLLAARLVLAVFAFVLALALSPEGRSDASVLAPWAVLAFAFFSTAVSAAFMKRVRRVRTFGALQLAVDVAVVTALVHFSGSGASAFGFLYLPIPVFGAVLFDRPGAYGAALLSSAAYAATLTGLGAAAPETAGLVLWSAQTGALLIVALLASTLARELRVTGERLDLSRARLSVLRNLHERTVESLSSGLLTTDPQLRITFFNPEAERITGRPAPEAVGRPLEEVLPGAGALAHDAERGQARMRARLELEGPGGERRHLGIAVSVLRAEGGVGIGYVAIFQDVTAVVRMEQELRRSSRLAGVGELAASIAHEIRNPLAAISGSVELLKNGESADSARLMDIVLREIERLDALIRDFLQYARPQAPKLAPVPLAPLFDDVLRMLETSLPAGAHVEQAAALDAVALADATQLRQVLWNLVRNALEALAGPGRVRLSAQRADGAPQDEAGSGRKRRAEGPGSVEIVVADTGRGIALADLERIFDPFYTTKPDGTGLGLPTVHRIVESHGGAIEVDSQPGAGTRFRVRLPAAEPHP
jgi:two-component system sensor histidine kinase PilS (NtrC family)